MIYKDIVSGLQEAIEFEKGERKLRTIKTALKPMKKYRAEEVKEIRNSLDMSQALFAGVIGVSPKTVEAWEAGATLLMDQPAGSCICFRRILSYQRSMTYLYRLDLERTQKNRPLVLSTLLPETKNVSGELPAGWAPGNQQQPAERSIKPFVIGRKNWLFSNTPKGAEARAVIYSVVETAKENDLNPFPYLQYLFEQLPNVDIKGPEILRRSLPWAKGLPHICRNLQR